MSETLLTVCLYGLEDNKKNVGECASKLQRQLDNIDRKDIDVMYYLDKGEKTNEEKKEWLIANTQGKYYSFIPEDYQIDRRHIRKQIAMIEGELVTEDERAQSGIFKRKSVLQIVK